MCFGAAPHPIPQLCADKVPGRRAMCTIFEISELRLLNHDSIRPVRCVNQDVVCFNILCLSATASLSEMKRFVAVMDNIFIV